MKPRVLLAPLVAMAWPILALAAAPATFNIQDFGAVPDGTTKDTAAIARAVAAAHAAGGGTIVFPAGRYLTGSIQLESNLTLDLEPGSELLYSSDPADSPIVPSRFEDTTAFVRAPLIYANGKENIAIVGRGTLNGQGRLWWWRLGSRWGRAPSPAQADLARTGRAAWLKLYDRIQAGESVSAADFTQADEYLRPTLVQPYNCKNFQLVGVTLTESPMWMFNPLYSDNVEVRGVTFQSDGPNTDGIDVDSCRNVRISDCFFRTGDDCIVIKSGRDADGRRVHRPCEFITITNCVMYNGHGAITIGSETSGDVRDVTASNIVSKGTDYGIRIKSMRGRGGVVENVRCDNFIIEDSGRTATDRGAKSAIEITLLYGPSHPEPLSERTPIFRNFAFSNITIVNATQVMAIHGLEEKSIDGLRFSDIQASGRIGLVCDYARDVEMHHVRIDATAGSAFSFDHTHDLVLDDVTSHAPLAGTPVIRLAGSGPVWLHASRALPGTGTFLQWDGPRPAGSLRLADNDLSDASVPVSP